jgi:hypothetical protein
MRKRLSYANVAATLALVFAMSGGALAANHYLITSTKQVSPKVLKKLTGKTGKTGATGATGATGKEGAAGKEGSLGKEGAAGKEGKEGGRGPSDVFSAFHDAEITIPSPPELHTIATLSGLPSGNFWVVATLQADNGTVSSLDLECRLNAGGDTDTKHFIIEPTGSPNASEETTTMQVVHTFATSGGTATVSCDTFGLTPIKVSNIKVTAMQAGAVSNTAI